MKIAIDAMGGDQGPKTTVKGSVDAVNEYEVNLVIVGKEELINKELSKYKYNKENIEVINAEQVITDQDEPARAIRRKKDSSMVVGLNMLKEKKVDAFISAGNTGALLSGGLLIVKRIKGIERPALATVYPTKKGVSLLLDVGANAECKPKYLQQFALMGSIYSEKILNKKDPKIGLINIGVEKEKGNTLTKQAYELLENTKNINFCGNIEGRNVPEGEIDVLICDGFVGNIVLKLTEGMGISIFDMLKQVFMKSTKTKLGALLLKSGLKEFSKKLDYTEYGGAPLLGVKGIVIKAHGSSDANAIKNAVRQAKQSLENNVIENIETNISLLGGNHE